MRLRVLIHALSLSGAGHYVRARALAGELAEAHEVMLTDAGRPVPLPLPSGVRGLALERLRREGAALRAEDDTDSALTRRRDQLVTATQAFGPDVVLVEHYPFSKWALAGEIDAMIDAARRANPSVRVLCSVRDFPLQTRHEDCSAQAWGTRVLDTLHGAFDAVLHHADPALLGFVTVFPAAARLRIPVYATGLVHRTEPDDAAHLPAALVDGARFALCSVGGGADGAGLAPVVREAWRRLRSRADVPLDLLVMCGVGGPSTAMEPDADGVLELPFVPRFDVLLRRARLSVSQAGYNTCADVLRFQIPALLVPHPAMSDQAPRAALMSRIGAATVVEHGALDPERLTRSIEDLLATGRASPACEPDLDGAHETRRLIEELALRPPAAGSGRS